MKNKCRKCKVEIDSFDTYEYRGALSCENCFDDVIADRDRERNQIISEEHSKTKAFKGLDLTDSCIGKANKKLLKSRIEIASKESARLNNYERNCD